MLSYFAVHKQLYKIMPFVIPLNILFATGIECQGTDNNGATDIYFPISLLSEHLFVASCKSFAIISSFDTHFIER